MPTFESLKAEGNLQEIIKVAFDADLPIDGAWGYSQSESTLIGTSDIPLQQIEHMFASMRAYVEMNMTQREEARYGSINLNELSREEVNLEKDRYHKVNYAITAIKETVYNVFIKEYKENYGKKEFDLSKHFQKRKEATLSREVIHWFKIN